VWIYRTLNGSPVFRVDLKSTVEAAGFSVDDRRILVAGSTLGLCSFTWRPVDLIAIAQSYVTRNLTSAEIDTYMPGEVSSPLALSAAVEPVVRAKK